MAAVKKSKEKQRAAASAVLGLAEEEDAARKAEIAKCVSKAGHLKRVIFKGGFSKGPILAKPIIERQHELAKRLDGVDPLATIVAGLQEAGGADEHLTRGYSARPSAISDDTIVLTERSLGPQAQPTYKELLDHVRQMERDVEALRGDP